MRKFTILIIYLGILLISAGCGSKEKNVSNFNHLKGIKLEEYIKTAELPENLELAFNAAEVLEKGSAKAYFIEWLKVNPEEIPKNFLRFDILEKDDSRGATAIKTGNGEWTESLSVGHSEDKVGLGYSLYKNDFSSLVIKLEKVVYTAPGFPNTSVQANKYMQRTDYDTKRNLAFLDYEKAVAEIKDFFKSFGIPQVEAQEVYSLDLETMKSQYEIYSNSTDNPAIYQWHEEDECYLIHFRQTFDDIPYINVQWEEWYASQIQRPYANEIYAIYSKDGIIEILARYLYKTRDKVKEGALINASAALEVLLKDYSKSTLMSQTKVVSMELNYVGITKGGKYQIVPAWVFGISSAQKINDFEYDEYSYFVIDAFTGNRIRTAVDNE